MEKVAIVGCGAYMEVVMVVQENGVVSKRQRLEKVISRPLPRF